MKNYIALALVSYLYRLAAILLFLLCLVAAIHYNDIETIIIGALSSLCLYAVGELLQLLIDMAKDISIQAKIKRHEYKATLGKPEPRKLQRLSDRKKAV